MSRIAPLLVSACLVLAAHSAEPAVLVEKFDGPLPQEWFWGLGTWTAKDGVLRGFESGARRHGPVKMRKFPMRDGTVECEFRLNGKATAAGIIFNGSQERGHIVHVLITKDQLRVIAHPKKGETLDLAKELRALNAGEWHRVKIEIKGAALTATVDGRPVTVSNPCLAEEKMTFGLGGDSGGPEGEKVGSLEFRSFKITAAP